MSTETKNNNGWDNILPYIFLILFTLKVAGIGIAADLSWVLVFAPLWIPFAAGVVTLVIFWLINNIGK